MPDKDVDEQFAAIMAHWDDVALGLDPLGDPLADDGAAADGGAETGPAAVAAPGSQPAPAPPPTAEPTAAPQTSPSSEGTAPHPATDPGPLPADDAPPVILSGWRQHAPPDVEEHFVPPPPAPLPSAEDKHFWLMMVGLIGGPLLFLYLILFARDGNGWWMMFALGMGIAGFVLLVLRQPAERDENDDGVRL